MTTKLDRTEKDIRRTRSKIAKSQKQLWELETRKTEQRDLQVIQLVRGMSVKPKEFAAFSRSGVMQATPTAIPYHEQEDNTHEG